MFYHFEAIWRLFNYSKRVIPTTKAKYRLNIKCFGGLAAVKQA